MKRLLLTLMLVGTAMVMHAQAVLNFSLVQPAAPGATFSYTSNLLQVDFTDASTGSISTYAWDFGDGNTSNLQNPTHTYGSDGTYIVCLTVTDAINCTSTSCDTVSVIAIGMEEQAGIAGLQIAPNPFDLSTEATFSLPASIQVSVRVTDLMGRTIETLFEGKAAAGNHRFQFGHQYPAGTYLLVVQTPNGQAIHKIIANH
jgi:PKD repeat protein